MGQAFDRRANFLRGESMPDPTNSGADMDRLSP